MKTKVITKLTFHPGIGKVAFVLRHPREGHFERRNLDRDVGQRLALLFPNGGSLTYAKTKPGFISHRLLVMPGEHGLVLLYYRPFVSHPEAEFVSMCATFRRFLGFDRVAKRRWYTVGR